MRKAGFFGVFFRGLGKTEVDTLPNMNKTKYLVVIEISKKKKFLKPKNHTEKKKTEGNLMYHDLSIFF